MASSDVNKVVHILHLEDNENDHVLVAETLSANNINCDFKLAKSRGEFEIALKRENFDLIISDFTLPSYDGLTALSLAREIRPEVPFVFFSGSIGEDIAVDSLQHGAVDYVLKQRPGRLVSAIRRALDNAAERARLKLAEMTLKQVEERFRIVARATNDVIWEWDVQTDKVWFSENFKMEYGRDIPATGISSKEWFEIIHPDDVQRVRSGFFTLLAGGGKVWWSEHRIRRSDNTFAHILDRASVIYDDARKPLRIVGVKIDMTERRRSEEKILEQAALLDKAQDAIIICNLEREIIYWNQGAQKIYGWSSDEAVGKNIRDLLFHGNVPDQIAEAVRSLEASGEWRGELVEYTKSGGKVTVQARSTLISDESGNPKSLVIINTDITERKQLEEQFFRAQRLESLGGLVSGIAHDLNNTLTPIIVGIQILREQNKTGEAGGILETMEYSAKRGAEMVRQVLAFARGTESSHVVMRVDKLVHEMVRIVKDTFPKNIECSLEMNEIAGQVSAIPTQLHQVLLNLCVNARDAMPNGGKLKISVKNTQVAATQNEKAIAGKKGNYLCISVSDTGTGIKPEYLEKIFQPFFTTKDPGKGTGLGLSTSMAIAKNHGGFMSVDSKVGIGTEFKLFLPTVIGTVQDETISIKPSFPVGDKQCILVVDDEESMLALVRSALENYNYCVVTASSGPEAIIHLAEKVDDIKLVISDIEMPFMDGFATIKALRKIKPDIKVVIATGSRQEDFIEQSDVNCDACIYKPFTTEKLLTTVHEVFASKK